MQKEKLSCATDFCLRTAGRAQSERENLKITCFDDIMAPRKWKPLICYQECNLQST